MYIQCKKPDTWPFPMVRTTPMHWKRREKNCHSANMKICVVPPNLSAEMARPYVCVGYCLQTNREMACVAEWVRKALHGLVCLFVSLLNV